MATAAPFVKLLRQLSNAKDEYRSGALDLTWDGGKSSIFVVFGQPNHATYETEDGEHLEGQDALAALVHHLPRKFKVAPWRKEVVRVESLKCTMEELVEPFAQLAGAAPEPEQQTTDDDSMISAGEEAAPIHIRLDSFPLLPLGESIWSEASASLLHLDVLIPKLPTSLVILTGPKLRAAAVIIRGAIVDALWVDEDGAAAGEGAAMAMIGAREGSLSGYKLEDAAVAEALTMLWRAPQAFVELPARWLDLDRFLGTLESERRDRALLVQSGGQRGVGLFMGGRFLAAYSEHQRQPVAGLQHLRELLGAEDATITMLQRAGDRVLHPIAESAYHLRGDELETARGTVESAPAAPAEAAPDVTEPQPVAGEAGEAEPRPTWRPHYDEQEEEAAAGTEAEPTWAPAAHEQVAPAAEQDGGWHQGEHTGAEPVAEHDASQSSDFFGAWDQPAEAGGAAATEFPPPPPPPPDWTPEQEYAPQPPPPAWHEEAQPAADVADAAPAATWSPAADYDDEEPEPDGEVSVDFNAVKQDLIQIGVRWLGNDDVVPVATLIDRTRNQVDDFVATIEQIKTTPVAGHDPSVIRAMAREMHYYAAEALCGA